MKKVRTGVIGCGVMGPRHMAAVASSPHMELVAISDLDQQKLQAQANEYPSARTYASGAELVRDKEIDAVVFAMPAADRDELAIEALKLGKHILVEKPVACNSQVVRRMMAVRGDLVAAACCSRYGFLESTKAAKQFVSTGALGRIRLVRVLAVRPAGPAPTGKRVEWRLRKDRNGGGVLMNWGCYDLDYVLNVCDWSLRPKMVLGQVWQAPGPYSNYPAAGSDAETHGLGLVICEDGAAIHFERGEFMTVAETGLWQIVGEKGSLRMAMTAAADKRHVLFDEATDQGTVTRTIWEGVDDNGVLHTLPAQDFGQAIAEGRQPQTTLQKALLIQQITDAVYRSAASGGCVAID